MPNIGIPLNSHINTKDNFIIHQIDTQEKDALQKKNTLQFQSTLSPMYYKSENKIMTTSGHTISINNHNYFTDEIGRKYPLEADWKVEQSVDISNLWNGELLSAYPYVNGTTKKVFSFWKTNNSSFSFVASDFNNNVLNHTDFDFAANTGFLAAGFAFCEGLTDSDRLFARVVTLTNSTQIVIYSLATSTNSFVSYRTITINEGNLGTDVTFTKTANWFVIGLEDKDARKRRCIYFSTTNPESASVRFIYGIGTVGANGLATGEPIPNSIVWNGFSDSRLHTLENGVLAYDLASYYTSDDVAKWISSNTSLKTESTYTIGVGDDEYSWGGVDHYPISTNIVMGVDFNTVNPYGLVATNTFISTEYEPTSAEANKTLSYSNYTYGPSAGPIGFPQCDFSDGLGNLEWNEGTEATIENGCNPFPLRFFIFNRASSRGVYWDYGKGWSKSYFRKFAFHNRDLKKTLTEAYPAAICSYGLSNPTTNTPTFGYHGIRIERLSPMTISNESFTYDMNEDYSECFKPSIPDAPTYLRFHKFNPTIFDTGMVWGEMVGADNMPNHSVLAAEPFSVGIFDSAEIQIADQYYQGIYMSTSARGTLLTSASAKKSKPSEVYERNSGTGYYVHSNGLVMYLNKNTTTYASITKVCDYIYKTNTLGGNNLIIDHKEGLSFQRAFIPYNGEQIIQLYELNGFSLPKDNENSDGNDTYYSASGYNVQMNDMNVRGTSYLLPAFQMPLSIKSEEIENFSFQLNNNKKSITRPMIYRTFTYKDDVVDHYYTDSQTTTSVYYKNGCQMETSPTDVFGVKTYDSTKENMAWWITSAIQIFPMGIASPITGINYISSNIDMTDNYSVRLYRTQNVVFPVYNPNTEVYKSNNIFTIYGNNYSFDGQAIYYLGSGEETTQSSFACYALGMKFLANSGTEAYFYSSFEKRLYLFNGSVTLQIADSLAREGDIVDSVYSSLEQILYLMTSDGNIIAKSQDDMCIITNVDPTAYHFEATDTGVILVSSTDYKRYRLWKTDETSWLPLEYETEFIGKNDSLFKVASIDLTFFKGDGRSISGLVDFECMNDKLVSNEKLEFKVAKKDWENTQLEKVRLTPENNVCKAFKFGITSNSYLHIANVCINVEEVSQNTNAAKHI